MLKSRLLNAIPAITYGLVLAFLLSGCVVVPYPVLRTSVSLISEEKIHSIEPGKTTREDLLRMLTEPYYRGDKGSYFMYVWEKIEGGWGFLWLFATPTGGTGGIESIDTKKSCHTLVVQFSDDGRVTRTKVFDGKVFSDFELARGKVDVTELFCHPELSKAVESWLKEESQ